MKSDLYDRALGSYIGFAIGDALGATTEFMTPREIAADFGVHDKIIGGGWLRLRAGNVTDDTGMCLALGESLINERGFHLRSVADHYVKWMRSKPVDIGGTVRKGLRGYMLNGITESAPSVYSAGNGACMRILPLVLYCQKDWSCFDEIAVMQNHLTHNNRWSDIITLCFSRMTKVLLEGEGKLAALDIGNNLVKENPKCSYSKYSGEASGYIIDTFKTVMHYFADSSSFEETLVRVVNQGGDADTNGAIAGMMAGAMHGYSSIPYKWIKKLNKKIQKQIEAQTKELLSIDVRVIK
jgi:ADP-ribosyl-[dinitrogen reductase] hydrolase